MKRTEAKKRGAWLMTAACFQVGLVLPNLALAADTHPDTMKDQECVECHADQSEVWLSGKHGLMNVKCVVCHGDPAINFVKQPTMARCRGCHGDKVQDVEKRRAANEQSCFLCHEHHTVAPTASAATTNKGFHTGGAK